ncbi:MAG TPA: SDR family oxidoreductase [Candidatus Acidoferrum sp.]|nr:SDR family oxidoreductase [Candidatus Acidoferrum sp.]
MKIVVVGGSGLIGARLVDKLREQGHETISAAPDSGVNSLSGEGLAEVMKDAAVVVDVTNAPSWEDTAVMNFFETSTRNLLTYGAAARVGHHVALSIVGSERMLDSGYFRAKIAQEKLIKESPIPYSIVRATQFFEFVRGIADFSTEGNKVKLPSALIQPMSAEDVASALAQVAVSKPIKGTLEIGGPEKFHLDELVRQGLKAFKDSREVVTDPHARYYGIPVSERTLIPGEDARLSKTRFADWLKQPSARTAASAH